MPFCSNYVAMCGDEAGTAVCYESHTEDLLGDVSNTASSSVHFISSNTYLLPVLLGRGHTILTSRELV